MPIAKKRTAAIAPLSILPVLVLLFFPSDWPRWALMWTLAGAIFFGCKWLTWYTAQRSGARLWINLGYLCAWPGLDADEFLQLNPTPAVQKPDSAEFVFALIKLALGVLLLFSAARQINLPSAAGWIGMTGIVFILHFGLFHVLSCAWRSIGVNAKSLMDWPIASKSFSEFWGRRWNSAFRDLSHRFVFTPLRDKLGAGKAIFVVFLLSGLVHELVISLPARAGYGGPTLFFLLQSGALFAERPAWARKLGLGTDIRGTIIVIAVLLVTAPLLFHQPFVGVVILPFMEAIGAI